MVTVYNAWNIYANKFALSIRMWQNIINCLYALPGIITRFKSLEAGVKRYGPGQEWLASGPWSKGPAQACAKVCTNVVVQWKRELLANLWAALRHRQALRKTRVCVRKALRSRPPGSNYLSVCNFSMIIDHFGGRTSGHLRSLREASARACLGCLPSVTKWFLSGPFADPSKRLCRCGVVSLPVLNGAKYLFFIHCKVSIIRFIYVGCYDLWRSAHTLVKCIRRIIIVFFFVHKQYADFY